MPKPNPHEVTQLLLAWSEGDKAAMDKLMPLVYGELRRLAKQHMRSERAGQGRVCLAKHQLSALQQDFLRAFFQREDRFFLTGGAALVGFHLGHRETHDLDLFTLEDVIPGFSHILICSGGRDEA